MTVGTMVTIVLLVIVLVLGIFFIREIFDVAHGAIDLTEAQLKNELNQLFSSNEDKKIVIYPENGLVEIKKGKVDDFGFSIRNIDKTEGIFSYETKIQEVASNCVMTEEEADNLIILGKSGSGINLRSGSIMDSAKRIRIEIPESAPLCTMDYILEITKDGEFYTQEYLTVTIK